MIVKFANIQDASEFSAICGMYGDDVDASYGRHSVDAKSLLGLIALGLEHEFEVNILTTHREIEADFASKIKKFCIA